MYSLRRRKLQIAKTRKALLGLEERGLVQFYSENGQERWRLTGQGEKVLLREAQVALGDES